MLGCYKAKACFCKTVDTVIKDTFYSIGNDKRSHCPGTILVFYMEVYFDRTTDMEQYADGIAKTNILCSLPHIKTKFCFPLPGSCAIDLQYRGLNFHTGKSRKQAPVSA